MVGVEDPLMALWFDEAVTTAHNLELNRRNNNQG